MECDMPVFRRNPTSLWAVLLCTISVYAWIATHALWWNLRASHFRLEFTSTVIWGFLPALTALIFRHRLLATVVAALGFWLIVAGALYGTLGGSNFWEETGFALFAPFEWPIYRRQNLHGNVNLHALFAGTNLAYAMVTFCFSLAAGFRPREESHPA
ncbi:MAG TPA: hypothetical protein VIK18_20570 [Pirellulales bacterium]